MALAFCCRSVQALAPINCHQCSRPRVRRLGNLCSPADSVMKVPATVGSIIGASREYRRSLHQMGGQRRPPQGAVRRAALYAPFRVLGRAPLRRPIARTVGRARELAQDHERAPSGGLRQLSRIAFERSNLAFGAELTARSSTVLWITPFTTRCTFPVAFSSTRMSVGPRKAMVVG
jgi:hypothetical protein